MKSSLDPEPVSARRRSRSRNKLVIAGAGLAPLVAAVVLISLVVTPRGSGAAGNTSVHSDASAQSGLSVRNSVSPADVASPRVSSASPSASARSTRGTSASSVQTPTSSPAVSSSSTTPGGSIAEGAFSTTVPALPASTVTEEGAIVQNGRVAGRDNGQSALIDGESVWVFDDTTMRDPWGFISNSGAATTDLDAADGIDLQSADVFSTAPGGTPESLIPLTGPEQAFQTEHDPAAGCARSTDIYCGAIYGFWPGPVIADPAHDRLLVLYGALCRNGVAGTPCTGSLGKSLGTGIAALNMGSDTVTRLTMSGMTPVASIEGPDPTLLFPASEGFGAAAVVVGPDVYVYGNCTWAGCDVGRVPLAQITDRAAWQFYTRAGTWSADLSAATTVIAPGGAGQTVFYDPALAAYVNVFMPYGSNDVDYQVGASPFGPWSASVTAAQTPGGAQVDYALFAHPEYAQDNGLIEYLSYFDPNTGQQRLLKLQFNHG